MSKLSKDTTAYKNKLNYIAKYNKENGKKKTIFFNINNERDMVLLTHLESKPCMAEYVKSLIEKDLKEKQ